MSQFQTIVHIAGEPQGKLQRCVRCGAVLITAEGAMSMHGAPMLSYAPGAFVGVTKCVDPGRSLSAPNPICSFEGTQESFWGRGGIVETNTEPLNPFSSFRMKADAIAQDEHSCRPTEHSKWRIIYPVTDTDDIVMIIATMDDGMAVQKVRHGRLIREPFKVSWQEWAAWRTEFIPEDIPHQ